MPLLTSIVAQPKANETYRAIIVPQTVALTLEVATSDGKTLSQKLTSTTLAQGGQYSVNIRVLPDDIEVKLSGDIENWTDEGEIELIMKFLLRNISIRTISCMIM